MSAIALLAAVHGAAAAGEKAGLVVLALLAAAVVLARPSRVPRRLQSAVIACLLLLTPVLLCVDIWHTGPMRHLRDHPLLALLAVILLLALVTGLALVFRRTSAAFPLLAVFALPFRLPVSTGGTTANLLVPLYLVIAGAALATLLPRRREALRSDGSRGADRRSATPPGAGLRSAEPPAAQLPRVEPSRAQLPSVEPSRARPPSVERTNAQPPRVEQANARLPSVEQADSQPARPSGNVKRASPAAIRAMLTTPFALEALLAAAVLLYAVQAIYSSDFSKALQNVVFFYAPFALLLCLLRQVHWTHALLARCGALVAGLAAIFVAVGFVEYQRKALFLDPQIVAAHVYDNYFRVNSVFFDPNIYGRFLVLVMLLLAVAALWSRSRKALLIAGGGLIWLWAGLITSFSQSSIVALLAGLVVIAGSRWRWRYALGGAAVAVLAAIVLLLAAPSSLHFGVKGAGGSVNTATSGRLRLVKGGVKLFAHRPLAGYGSGSFAPEYRAHQSASTAIATSASHTTPVTVAAEQGIVGLLVYVALLIACFVTLFSRASRSPPRVAIAACFSALVVHSLAYADFLEDPVTWALLGIGIALALAARAELSASIDIESAVCAPARSAHVAQAG